MPPELLVRPGPQDHKLIAEVLSPGGARVTLARRQRIIGRLVVGSTIAAARPEFADLAAARGVPLVIDPLTPILQGGATRGDSWSRLPYGSSRPHDARDFTTAAARDQLVDKVIAFQVDHGATTVVAPYFYATSTTDPWWRLGLDLIARTRVRMEKHGIALPLLTIAGIRLQTFGKESDWRLGVDAFAAASLRADAESTGLAASPVGDGKHDSYDKIVQLFLTAERLKKRVGHVIAWRQGVYGEALVAAGLGGYETGIGTAERCDLRRLATSRRSRGSGGGGTGIFLAPLGRSVKRDIGEPLLEHRNMQARIVCTDTRCCPNGSLTMLESPRHHALRSRARMLGELAEIPSQEWRLHQVRSAAREAIVTARMAERVLKASGLSCPFSFKAYESLCQSIDFLAERDTGRGVA